MRYLARILALLLRCDPADAESLDILSAALWILALGGSISAWLFLITAL